MKQKGGGEIGGGGHPQTNKTKETKEEKIKEKEKLRKIQGGGIAKKK